MKKHSCLHFCSLPDNSYSCGIKGERERERERKSIRMGEIESIGRGEGERENK